MPEWVAYLLISGVAFLVARILKEPTKPLETNFGDGVRILKGGRWVKKW